MDSIRVVGFGAMNLDALYQVESVLADNETTIKEHQSLPGGSAANTIYGLAKLGISTSFIGAVGNDKEGELLLQDLREVGVDTSQIKVKEHAKTGSVLGLTDSHGNRALYVAAGANSLLAREDISLEHIEQAEITHLSSFVDDLQFELQKWIVSNLLQSVKISFTPGALYAIKGLKALAPLLSKTYLLFLNQNELYQLTGEDVLVGTESCLNQGCHIVAVTLGKGARLEIGKGIGHRTVTAVCYIRDANNEYAIESDSQAMVSEVDTTGAGDAFATGFLYGLLRGKGLEECGRLGGLVAQFSITKLGARQGLPTLAELAQRYQELYLGQL
jgi:ribokinase